MPPNYAFYLKLALAITMIFLLLCTVRNSVQLLKRRLCTGEGDS